MTFNKKRGGFTLIELLVVIAILATIAGGILVSYDGLETDAAQAQAAFNISATDRAVRTYRTLNKAFPDRLDSLLFSPNGTGTDGTALNSLNSKIKGKIGPYALTPAAVTALSAVGIKNVRYVSGTATNSASGTYNNTTSSVSIPNRVFDNVDRGFGVQQPLAAGMILPAIESFYASGGIAPFVAPTATPPPASDSSRLRDICGLDQSLVHVVVALGLGNNSTMVADSSTGGTFGTLAEAPYYTNIAKNEYGRYLLLFHLGSGANLGSVTYFNEARFVAVLDTKGDWLDEEYAEFTNQKQ